LQARKQLQDPECLLQMTGIMMALHLVECPVEEELELNDDTSKSLHGCKIMLHLLCTWSSTSWQIVCADSYFASSSAALKLYSKQFRFIGVVKTATRLFPKACLSTIELPNREAVLVLIRSTDNCELLAFVYCDHDRHYFISTCANIAGGDPISMFCCSRCSWLIHMKNWSVN
jgi:hypothetical protein